MSKLKQTKTESTEWGGIIGKEFNEMKTGSNDISWIYEFLGWKKHARRT